MFEYDLHFRECKKLNKPFIKAKINPKTCDYFVQIDLMTCTHKLSIPDQDYIKKLAKKYMNLKNTSPKSEYDVMSVTEELAWFDGIFIEHVDSFCNDLYDFVIERDLESN